MATHANNGNPSTLADEARAFFYQAHSTYSTLTSYARNIAGGANAGYQEVKPELKNAVSKAANVAFNTADSARALIAGGLTNLLEGTENFIENHPPLRELSHALGDAMHPIDMAHLRFYEKYVADLEAQMERTVENAPEAIAGVAALLQGYVLSGLAVQLRSPVAGIKHAYAILAIRK